jgi:hypothetical protein
MISTSFVIIVENASQKFQEQISEMNPSITGKIEK